MVIIIGILAVLAYSSLMELIFTNRAKETAQTMRTFAERALAEGKRQSKTVELDVNSTDIRYKVEGETNYITQPLSTGYSASSTAPNSKCESGTLVSFNGGAVSQNLIGISSIVQKADATKSEGYFSACDSKGYCGAAVKVRGKNSFTACIKKGAKATDWEAL